MCMWYTSIYTQHEYIYVCACVSESILLHAYMRVSYASEPVRLMPDPAHQKKYHQSSPTEHLFYYITYPRSSSCI